MILNNPENRKAINSYLESVPEDDYIHEFVIPFYSSQGYTLYRINPHGPGEHGKDLIFYKHIPSFYDDEYLVIQAKSEKLTTGNVVKFSDQIKRALEITFSPKSGGARLQPHYAIFINSKQHTSDGELEFQEFIRGNPHIKILHQENVCELILKSGIGPKKLIDSLGKSTAEESSPEDELVCKTIMKNVLSEIDFLLEYKLKFMDETISVKTKEIVIGYIYDRWQRDRTWEGTVKPMKWFDTYFDFMTEKQYKYLITILEELSDWNPSYEAIGYTHSIVKKITPIMLKKIEEAFIIFCAKFVLSPHNAPHGDYSPVILEKMRELRDSNLLTGRHLEIINKIIDFGESFFDVPEYEAVSTEIREIAYPDLSRKIRERRERKKHS
jgi:hypothetical protein